MNLLLYQNAVHYRNQRIGLPSHDLVLFAELLRELGCTVSMSQVLDANKALTVLDVFQQTELYEGLKCTLTRSPEEQQIYANAFPVFWERISEGGRDQQALQALAKDEKPGTSDDQEKVKSFTLTGETQVSQTNREDGGKQASFSPFGVSQVAPVIRSEPLEGKRKQEVHAMLRLLQSRYSRKRKRSARKDRLYLRDMLRKNRKYGGEPIEFSWTRPLRRKFQLAAFCDVSTSMNPFTPFFFTFLHTVTQIAPSTETAIFNVNMEFISSFLKHHSLESAVKNIHHISTGLSGGTRIGECLQQFNQELKKRTQSSRETIVLILSDGWDVGDIPLLEREMRRLHQSVARVIWLHPYAHVPGFQPEVEGLKVSAPFIDDLLPFHDPASIQQVVGQVKKWVKRQTSK